MKYGRQSNSVSEKEKAAFLPSKGGFPTLLMAASLPSKGGFLTLLI